MRVMTTCVQGRPGTLLPALLFAALTALVPTNSPAWPLDDADATGIGRLEYMRRVEAGALHGTKQPPGALLPTAAVDLRLLDQPDFELPPPDPGLTAAVRALLGGNADRYSLALLDLSNPGRPVYAEHRADQRLNPGSVGKLVVALAWMQALADRFGDDLEARWQTLTGTHIVADDVIHTDSHTVRRWDRAGDRLIRRPLEVGDPGTLFEFLDWMVSPSSNAAASVLIRQAMLFRQFGADYPPSSETAVDFFKTTPPAELNELLRRTLQQPVIDNGFDIADLRQGSLFTRTGKRLVGGTTSRATPRELMRFLVRLEQGRVVDPFSSRIIKRLMYVTERRIRYATAPALREAAVYFKSGSLYKCKEEPGYECRKYRGNVMNLMHSVAIVEAPAAERRLHYLVVVMSNVLKKNSAEDHRALGGAIHGLIAARNPAPSPQATTALTGDVAPAGGTSAGVTAPQAAAPAAE
ncbi:MAG: hypothetical protein ACU85V_14165 [Gammaproteobacteria bacterium]